MSKRYEDADLDALNALSAARKDVEITGWIARRLVKSIRQQGLGNVKSAIERIARQAGLSVNTVKAHVQPSRRPKAFNAHVRARLGGLWLRQCERRLAALQNEVELARRLGPVNEDHSRMVDDAQALAGEVEALIEALGSRQ